MKPRRDKVLIRRSRWDLWILASLVAWIGVGVYMWRVGVLRWEFLLALPIVIAPWLFLRYTTPREGMHVPTLRGTPGLGVLLSFAAGSLALTVGLMVIDEMVFHHPRNAPLEAYHILLYSPPFLILMTGAIWADRIQKAATSQEPESSFDIDQ